MNCTRAQSLITQFINGKLNIEKLEEFIDHVESCASCREELEVYYALLTAMKQLDEDKNLSEDFSLELSQQIEKAKEWIWHVKYTYYRKKAILFLSMILISLLLSFNYTNYEKHEEYKVSNFTLRTSFRYGREKYIEKRLEEYYSQHGLYKSKPTEDVYRGRKEEPQVETEQPVEEQ